MSFLFFFFLLFDSARFVACRHFRCWEWGASNDAGERRKKKTLDFVLCCFLSADFRHLFWCSEWDLENTEWPPASLGPSEPDMEDAWSNGLSVTWISVGKTIAVEKNRFFSETPASFDDFFRFLHVFALIFTWLLFSILYNTAYCHFLPLPWTLIGCSLRSLLLIVCAIKRITSISPSSPLSHRVHRSGMMANDICSNNNKNFLDILFQTCSFLQPFQKLWLLFNFAKLIYYFFSIDFCFIPFFLVCYAVCYCVYFQNEGSAESKLVAKIAIDYWLIIHEVFFFLPLNC